MQVRIQATNRVASGTVLPSPRVDLVFEKDGTHGAVVYFVEPAAVIPECGCRAPFLQLCIGDLAAVVAGLQDGTKVSINMSGLGIQTSAAMFEERVKQIIMEAMP